MTFMRLMKDKTIAMDKESDLHEVDERQNDSDG